MTIPLVTLVAALTAAGCAGSAGGPAARSTAPSPEDTAGRTVSQAPAQDPSELVPPGYGTLRQDEITVQFRKGPLLIKVTPLSEAVTRLTAPDTYQRLHALAESRGSDIIASTGREPELFLVSLFSYEPNVEFQPEDLQITAQGRRMRPIEIAPVTPGWGRQLLQQQETQTAVYVFDEPIDYYRPITVEFGFERSDAWEGILRRLEIERAKVRARSAARS